MKQRNRKYLFTITASLLLVLMFLLCITPAFINASAEEKPKDRNKLQMIRGGGRKDKATIIPCCETECDHAVNEALSHTETLTYPIKETASDDRDLFSNDTSRKTYPHRKQIHYRHSWSHSGSTYATVTKSVYNAGGADLTDVFGLYRKDLLGWLGLHVNDTYYLGTPYADANRANPNGDTGYDGGAAGMNCTGFVHHAITSAAWWRDETYIRDIVPRISGWVSMIRGNQMEYITYTSDDWNALAAAVTSGDAEPGDILWMWDLSVGPLDGDGLSSQLSNNHHIAI